MLAPRLPAVMLRSMNLRPLIAAALLLLAAPVLAWSEPGHMATGAIAYDTLVREHPELLPQIEAIIAAHPDKARLDAATAGLTGSARTRAQFQWLARWPDDIRAGQGTDGKWDHPDWHYELRVVSPAKAIWPWRNGNAGDAFALNYAVFSDPSAAPADRAVALGWLMHIVGDIQQPLHAGHWMSWQYKMTDRAGQLGHVRRTRGGTPIDLHAYWDNIFDLPGGPEATPRGWAVPVAMRWPRALAIPAAPAGTPAQQFSAWMDESHALARDFAYTDAFLHATPVALGAPAVSDTYRAKSMLVAQQRLAAGGYRIADTLTMALAKP